MCVCVWVCVSVCVFVCVCAGFNQHHSVSSSVSAASLLAAAQQLWITTYSTLCREKKKTYGTKRSEFKSLLLSFLSTRGRRRSHFTPSLRSSNTESDKNTQLASEKTRTFSCLINNLKERRYDEQTLCCGVGAAVSLGWLGGASRLLHHPSCLLHLTSPETLQLRPPGGEFSDGDATAHNLLDQLHHERNTSSN